MMRAAVALRDLASRVLDLVARRVSWREALVIGVVAVPMALAFYAVMIATVSDPFEHVSNRLEGYVLANLVILGPPIVAFIAAVLVTRLVGRVFRKGTHED